MKYEQLACCWNRLREINSRHLVKKEIEERKWTKSKQERETQRQVRKSSAFKVKTDNAFLLRITTKSQKIEEKLFPRQNEQVLSSELPPFLNFLPTAILSGFLIFLDESRRIISV